MWSKQRWEKVLAERAAAKARASARLVEARKRPAASRRSEAPFQPSPITLRVLQLVATENGIQPGVLAVKMWPQEERRDESYDPLRTPVRSAASYEWMGRRYLRWMQERGLVKPVDGRYYLTPAGRSLIS
jgi:hypothetical protein